MLRLPIALLLLSLGATLRAQPQPAEAPPLLGRLDGQTYIPPTKAYKILSPVLPELGGTITDTENVVTFEDDYNIHLSIAAFPQDATQRWELSTRGTKDYLIYFFTSFVLPDFQQRYSGARVESARFIPALQNGALLAYTLLPGGSMFTDRATISGAAEGTPVVAKRGNLLFVNSGHIFVLSTELAERVIERSTYKKTTAEEDDLLRLRLLDIVSKMEFPKPPAPAK